MLRRLTILFFVALTVTACKQGNVPEAPPEHDLARDYFSFANISSSSPII